MLTRRDWWLWIALMAAAVLAHALWAYFVRGPWVAAAR